MDIIADTNSGKIRGLSSGTVHIFKGVPYGDTTAGDNRFKPARAPKPWAGIRDATTYGPTAPQANPFAAEAEMEVDAATKARRSAFHAFIHGLSGDEPAMSEDCLVLNVWTGGLGRDRKRPVLVFLHGGAFTTGSGSWRMYDGTGLASRGDAVVVTVNHRLGALGFLYLGELDDAYAASGNVGMLDITLALKWVRDNIANFGGDPDHVMIFGSSGGASKCSTLMAMPDAKGLFHTANLMSGPLIRSTTTDAAAASTGRLLQRLGIDRKDFRRLHDVPFETLVTEAEHIGVPITSGLAAAASPEAFMPLQPVLDGIVLPGHPMDPVASPFGRDVTVLIGSTKDDMKMMMLGLPWYGVLDEAGLQAMATANFGDLGPAIYAAYRRESPNASPTEIACEFVTDRVMWAGATDWAERKISAGGAPVYVYRFDFASAAMGGILGATHGGDIPFAMNNYDCSTMAGDRPENAAMAKLMSDAWVHFAATGNPSHDGLPKWEPYTCTHRATMILDVPPRVEIDPRSELRTLLDQVLNGGRRPGA